MKRGNLSELGSNLIVIAQRLLSNNNLCKLIHYEGKDPLNEDDIDNPFVLLHNGIYVVPDQGSQKKSESKIILLFTRGDINNENQYYRDLLLRALIYVPLDQWIIKGNNFRNFLIMGEIQKSLVGKRIDGLGTIQGGDFQLNSLTNEMSVYGMDFNFIVQA